jgi:hypothetical protein
MQATTIPKPARNPTLRRPWYGLLQFAYPAPRCLYPTTHSIRQGTVAQSAMTSRQHNMNWRSMHWAYVIKYAINSNACVTPKSPGKSGL